MGANGSLNSQEPREGGGVTRAGIKFIKKLWRNYSRDEYILIKINTGSIRKLPSCAFTAVAELARLLIVSKPRYQPKLFCFLSLFTNLILRTDDNVSKISI